MMRGYRHLNRSLTSGHGYLCHATPEAIAASPTVDDLNQQVFIGLDGLALTHGASLDESGRDNVVLRWHLSDAVRTDDQWASRFEAFETIVTATLLCIDSARQAVPGDMTWVPRCRQAIERQLAMASRGFARAEPAWQLSTDYSLRLLMDSGAVSSLGRANSDAMAQLDYGLEVREDSKAAFWRIQLRAEGAVAVDGRGVFGGRVSVGPHWGVRRGRLFFRLGPELSYSGYGNDGGASWYLPSAAGVDVRTLMLARLFRQQVVYAVIRPGWVFRGERSVGGIHESHVEVGAGLLRALDLYISAYQTQSYAGRRTGLRLSTNL